MRSGSPSAEQSVQSVQSVLAPLAGRYPAVKAGVIPPDGAGPVWAMPVVLRLERAGAQGAASRTAVLEAAAAAALAVCLDERAAPGGQWREPLEHWVAGRIRKIARRARGAHWTAVQELPGVTCAAAIPELPGVTGGVAIPELPVTTGAAAGQAPYRVAADPERAAGVRGGFAQVRALLPGPVDDVLRVVSRLQIGGTDLAPDQPGPPPDGAVCIWLNPGVAMTVGKAAAQVGHASMLYAAVRGLVEVPRFAVRVAAQTHWAGLCAAVARDEAVAVRDAGYTEVDPGTITCIVR